MRQQGSYITVTSNAAKMPFTITAFKYPATGNRYMYYPSARATYSPQVKRVYLLSSSNNRQQVNRVALAANAAVQAAGNLASNSGKYKTNGDFITLKMPANAGERT